MAAACPIPTAALDRFNHARFKLCFVGEALSQGTAEVPACLSPEAVTGLSLILLDCDAAIEEGVRLLDA